ncbi:hypothetical protein IC762_19565 [Bradyrhizobium genosp. L]|uniref:hypothetical protein n=1 Tax=Bradyrhizobium genosp. L TaxID=83637 RepID=UPI0018A2B46B|nr:hypothetical protein [Bradyrhizobium genosp. L]QPF81994.1 hypothetical protein IC762_19565 [Bradyrhizobium genosp. L]
MGTFEPKGLFTPEFSAMGVSRTWLPTFGPYTLRLRRYSILFHARSAVGGHCRMRWKLWLGCAVPIYFILANWLSYAYVPVLTAPGVGGERHELMRPFVPINSTFAMTSVDPWFGDLADRAGDLDGTSPIVIYEDDKPLGPAHSTPHAEISTLGHGRFSHWKGSFSVFVFSSSDNTDPRTNGRTYWAVKPPIPKGSGIVPDVPGEKHLLERPFKPFATSPFAVSTRDKWFADVADVAGQFDSSSPIMIYEDGKPLGPAHSTPHDTIATLGHGRFSHWMGNYPVFVFSSSDNTDPETNGRDYWVVRPPPPKGSGIVPDVPGEKHLLERPFVRFGKSPFAAIAKDDWFSDSADVPGRFDSSSPIMIYEDGKPLGRAHSTPHDLISSRGHGRFSHWKGNASVFVFSSSDNTDPETNGRDYWAVKPERDR